MHGACKPRSSVNGEEKAAVKLRTVMEKRKTRGNSVKSKARIQVWQ